MYRQDYLYRSTAHPSGKEGIALTDLLIELIRALPANRRICELGCGNGYLVAQMARNGMETVGIDASETGIALAQSNEGSSAEFFCHTISPNLAQMLDIGGFDVVVSSEVIEHLYRPADLLEAASSLLSPHGYLVLTTPYHGYIKNLAICASGHFDRHFNPLWTGGHIKFFSIRSLTELVQQSGFTNLKFTFFGRMPYLWKSMICIARRA